MSFAFARFLAALILCGVALTGWAEIAIPPLTQWVTDTSGTLSNDEKSALEQRLAAFATTKGAQVAVLIVPTTEDEPIEGYALRAAEAWKLGRKGVDDGILLVIAKDDRHLRIEVGYGLEGALPDAIAKRIIAESIVPHFKSGNFFAGVNAGVERILGVVSGEALPAPTPQINSSRDSLGVALFLAFFFAMLFRGIGRVNAVRVPLSAAASGGLTFLLTSAGFAAGISAFAAVIIAGMLGAGIGGSGPGGWTSHRRYGGFSGGLGGGGFGGGFGGGGGGSFGGGGASGSW